MINEDTFVQYQLPVLYRVCTIKQPVDDISLEFWDNLVQLLEVQEEGLIGENQIKQNQKDKDKEEKCKDKDKVKDNVNKKCTQLLIVKGKLGDIVIWRLQNGCIMFQKSIKIAYATCKQITCIKSFSFRQTEQKNQQINILTLGYFDGIVQIYQINLQPYSIKLTKYLTIKSPNQQPATDVAIYNQSILYVCRCHVVFMYPKIIQQLRRKILTKSKEQIKCSQTLLKLKELHSSGNKIAMHVSANNLHIYNQMEGLFTFSLPEMDNSGTVIDSIKCLLETDEEDLIISSADDTLKIIYAQSNEIEKLIGLKSFVSTIKVNQIKQEKVLQLWMGDMYGEIHYLIKKKNRIVSKTKKQQEKQNQLGTTQKQLVMFEEELTKSVKITQNGIKKLLIARNILILVDTQMNIIVYDIIRNVGSLTGRSSK